MSYIYYMRADTIYDEDGKPYIVYGIEAINPQGEVLSSFPDVFFDKQKAENFVKLCNDSSLDIIHLSDVVEDSITEQYAVC